MSSLPDINIEEVLTDLSLHQNTTAPPSVKRKVGRPKKESLSVNVIEDKPPTPTPTPTPTPPPTPDESDTRAAQIVQEYLQAQSQVTEQEEQEYYPLHWLTPYLPEWLPPTVAVGSVLGVLLGVVFVKWGKRLFKPKEFLQTVSDAGVPLPS